jgi:predicted transcriptional regulator
MNLLNVAFSKNIVMISSLTSDGIFDNKHIVSESPIAIDWAKELFDHYLKDSTPITEI